MKTCFFIGQQDAPESLQESIDSAADFLVRKNHVTEFVVGNHSKFDRMAIAAVQESIRRYPDKEIAAYLLEPNPVACVPARLPALFEHFYCPPEALFASKGYRREKAERYMLEQSDYLIAYCPFATGTALRLFRRAKKLRAQGMIIVLDLTQWR